MYVYNKTNDGKLEIIDNPVPQIQLLENQEHIAQFSYLFNLKTIDKISYIAKGITNTRTLEVCYRISKDQIKWSDWYTVENNVSCINNSIDPSESYFIQIRFKRTGKSKVGAIFITSYSLIGTWDRPFIDQFSRIDNNTTLFVRNPNIYKVLSLKDVEVLTSGVTPTNYLDIKFRYTQDSGRTWSDFIPLTSANLKTLKISPIRFFTIEYQITKIGNNPISLFEIHLIGDFQNVSQDYLKTNLLGIKENCYASCCSSCGDESNPTNTNKPDESLPDFIAKDMTSDELGKLFRPYDVNRAVLLQEALADRSLQIFGWDVEYFLTNPDLNGIDTFLHEYQLYNVDCYKQIKIAVPDNQFPDSQIVINQFDLGLFENFEVHITKKEFKRFFGVEARPSKEDFIYFCQINRMYQVSHVNAYRDFNNSAIYYRVTLKKYEKKANVRATDESIEDRIQQLTANRDLDSLFEMDVKAEIIKATNPQQTKNTTLDIVRHTYNTKINREVINNATLEVSTTQYDLNISEQKAVIYKLVDNYIKEGDNRAFTSWFKFTNYNTEENYNLLTNYDDINNIGYRIDILDGDLIFTYGEDIYELNVSLESNIWYSYLINLNQVQRKVELYVYKRNISNESLASLAKSSKLKLLFSNSFDIIPKEMELDANTQEIFINSSNMFLTNIRIYNDIIDLDYHSKMLNEKISRYAEYLILADNADEKITLPIIPYN